MRRRNLEYHVLIGAGSERYALLDHPEITIVRHHGTGGFRGWRILYNGYANEHDSCSSLEDADRELLRFGNCLDCGKFCRREGHPRQRCPLCNSSHKERSDGYTRGKSAAESADRTWAYVERIRAAPSTLAAVEQILRIAPLT